MNPIEFIERGRLVKRFHTHPMLTEQRIDAHSYGVAMLTTILVPTATPERRCRLLMASLTHDLAEQKGGDIPAPFKREVPEARSMLGAYEDKVLRENGFLIILDARDQRVVKLADAADGALHCVYERMLGNVYAEEAFRNFWVYLTVEQKMGNIPEIEAGEVTLMSHIAAKWLEASGEVI